MEKLLLKNLDHILTMDEEGTELKNADILINGTVIESVKSNTDVPPNTQVIDGSGKVALPGFVNTHHHMYQIYTRDLPRTVNSLDMFDWLKINYELWHELDPEFVYVSALVGLGLLLKTGCTLISDLFYVFPDSTSCELIDAEIEAAKLIGARFHPTRGAMSLDTSKGGTPPKNVIQSDDKILLDYERLVNKYHDPSPQSMLRIALAPCSPFSVTPNLMKETIKFARQHGLNCHTHLAEAVIEDEWCEQKFNMRPFEYMESLGWVGPDVWYAHAIYVNDEEMKRMGDYRCGVASCPVCNARAGHGIANILTMRDAGVRVGFGVDGAGGYGDMIAEIQTAYVLHKLNSIKFQRERRTSAREMLEIASKGGATVLGWDNLGSIAPGKGADISLIDTRKLDYAGSVHDIITAIVMFGSTHTVDTTIVNGEIVVRDGKLTKINEEEVYYRANQLSKELLRKASHRTGMNYFEIPENHR